MQSEINEIKAAFKRLGKIDRRTLLIWVSKEFKNEFKEIDAYAMEIWGAMSRGILKATYIDIREKCHEHEYVLYRSLVIFHMYNDWLAGASAWTVGKATGLSAATVLYYVNKIGEALQYDRNIPIWKEYHEANDLVMTIFNNYIKQ